MRMVVKTAIELADEAQKKREAIEKLRGELKTEEALTRRMDIAEDMRTLALIAAAYDIGASIAAALSKESTVYLADD